VEILTRSSNEAKTSHVIAANLSKLELKKIRIDKMESLLMIRSVDPHGFEGYLKMVVEVPDSS
ncbi:hypothetical protein Tco_0245986, partial [Tanacetum coccineum]